MNIHKIETLGNKTRFSSKLALDIWDQTEGESLLAQDTRCTIFVYLYIYR